MASQMIYILDGTEIVPENAKDIGISMDWSNQDKAIENELNVDSIKLSREAKNIVLNHILSYGVFQGIPLTIQIENVSLEYYVDLTSRPKLSGEGDGNIEVKIKKRKSFEWFKGNADVLSFEAINKKSTISTFNVPYMIVRDNQEIMLITMAISTFSMAKALAEGIRELAELTAETTDVAGPTTGVGLGLAAGFPPALVSTVNNGIDLGKIIAFVLRVVVRIILLAAILFAIINMIKRMMDIIFPPVHNLKASTFLTLLNAGCAHLGFSFQSSILSGTYAPLALLPVPLIDESPSIWDTLFASAFTTSFNKGYPTANDTTPTLGSLIDAVGDMFNARIRVEGNVVRLERRDFFRATSAKNVSNTLNLQNIRENEFTYNTGDAWKRHYIHYQKDLSDTHTMDRMKGVNSEHSTEPINILADDLINIKGLLDVNIPFAYAARKDKLNIIENAVLPLAKLADKVTGIFGGGTSFISKIKARVGVVQISQQHFGTTKILYQFGGKQPSNYVDFLKGDTLYQLFHFIDEVDRNFKRIFNATMQFSSQDFAALQDNNYVFDETGNELELLNFDWINENKTAEIEYAVDASSENTNVRTDKISG